MGKGRKGKKKTWNTADLDFDEDGNLLIINRSLAKALTKAIYKAERRFCIRIQQDTRNRDANRKKSDKTLDDGGGGNHTPANAMCPC